MGWTDEELDAWVAERRRKERRAARVEFWRYGPGAGVLLVAPFLFLWLAALLLDWNAHPFQPR